MLLRITENKIQDFDFSKPLSITSKIYTNEKFSRIMLILTYGKYNTILYSCTTISNDAAKMLMDFLSFVGKQTVIRIFDTASKGERLINLVSIIDDIIKSNISKRDADILQDCYERDAYMAKSFILNGIDMNDFDDFYVNRLTFDKYIIAYLNGEKNDTNSISS